MAESPIPAHFMIFGGRNLFGQQFVQLLNQKRISFTLANLAETNEQLSAEILEIAPSHIIFIFNASELTEGLNFYFLKSPKSRFSIRNYSILYCLNLNSERLTENV